MKATRKNLKQKNLERKDVKALSTDMLAQAQGGNERFPDVEDPANP